MLKRIGMRLLRTLLTMFGVLTITFFLMHLSGDPASLMLPESATRQDIAALNKALGYDRPLSVQYVGYLSGVMHGDFGMSLRQGMPAMPLALSRLPATIELALCAFVAGFGGAAICAIVVQLSGSHRLRALLLWLGIVRQAMPSFVFAVVSVFIFAVKLRWLPSIGRGGFSHLVLPTLAIASFEVTLYFRMSDWALEQERSRDYVRTARAKGAGRLRVVLRHMLPNAALPVITVAGVNLGALLGGLLIIEKVFNWPGIGSLVVDAVNTRDFPVVQAGLLTVSGCFIILNLLVDLIYTAIDPRLTSR